MKIRFRYIALLFSSATLAWVVVMKYWPQQVRVLGEAANNHDLKLAIWQNGGFEEVAFTPNGKAAVGKGAWRAPWQERGTVIAVYDNKTMYWEGGIKLPVLGCVSITLSEGRPRENSANTTGEQTGTGQPATRAVVEPEGGDEPQPEAERRSR